MTTVYSLLDGSTRSWWYHAKLRKEGRIAEARKRERQSIRNTVSMLRDALANGGYVRVAPFGTSIHYRDGATASGYLGMDDPTVKACLLVGIPVIDTTTIPEDRRVKFAVSEPMASMTEEPDRMCCGLGRCIGSTPCDIDHDPDDYGSMDHAPWSWWVAMAKRYGATVHNA